MISVQTKPIRSVMFHSLILTVIDDRANPNSIFYNSFVRNDNNKHAGADNGTRTIFRNESRH
jgi:hypothetical protein